MAEGEQHRPFWGADAILDLEALSRELNLPEFDLLLVGDGSGTISNKCCGWACVAWDKINEDIVIHNGGLSCGTNNFAELIPYVQALWQFNQLAGEALPTNPYRVEIVSDSEVTVKCGNREYTRRGNACLWAAIEWFERSGLYTLHWNHVYRNTNRFSKRCDWLAGQTRVALEDIRRRLLSK